jgi:predicted HicB family RNase H-like nuclease
VTDTDIAALIERLRKVKAETAREAADALEACQAKLATVAEPVDDGIGRFTICVEKLLCEKLGKPWRASGISIATLNWKPWCGKCWMLALTALPSRKR